MSFLNKKSILPDAFFYKTTVRIAKNKNTIAKPSVNQEITNSLPLSLVFVAKTFMPPPVIAPEAPSDLPPWSKDKIITITQTIINKILVRKKIHLFW